MAQAVKVEIRLSMVKRAETMMSNPAQKEIVPCCELTRFCLTSVVTWAELKRTPAEKSIGN